MRARPVHHCACPVCQTLCPSATDAVVSAYHHQINLLLSRLDEPQRRWYVATLSIQPNSPPDTSLSQITGLDEKTIRRGREEMLSDLTSVPQDRLRQEGGGRPASEKKTARSNQT